MNLINLIAQNLFSFIAIISAIVFIHEFGHFIVARICGVKVEEFAIGFGKKLFSFRDKKNTEWKFCLLPFGGYVKMFGDRNAASIADEEAIAKMSEEEKKQSFIAKNVWQKIAIVAAGPLFNFTLAIIIFTFLFAANGKNKVLPIIDEVLENSAALEAGIKKDDEILAINQSEISDFNQIAQIVSEWKNEELIFTIKRENKILQLKITPKIQIRKNIFGEENPMPTLGISASQIVSEKLNLAQSFILASSETYQISIKILQTLGELISGQRSIKELGGPVKIAKYSGKSFEMGIITVLWFSAMISINLGVMNLLPIPVLDGGHLLFYAIEAIFRKPLPKKIQAIAFNFGFSLIISLMIFTTINDFMQIFAK
jgi:regulator of sigma E protease